MGTHLNLGKYTIDALLIEKDPEQAHPLKQMFSESNGKCVNLDWVQSLSESLAGLSWGKYDVVLLGPSAGESGTGDVERLYSAAPNVPVIALNHSLTGPSGDDASRIGGADKAASGQLPRVLATHCLESSIELQRLREAMGCVTSRDALTGLPNRATFLASVGRAIARDAQESDYSCTLMFLDLDHFRKVNDSLGYEAGDLLLREVGLRLKTCLGPDDLVSRFGGDEFAILLDGVGDPEGAARIAQRINEQISLPFALNGQVAFITTSIGLAFAESGYQHPDEMLRDADTAMYRAKAGGRAGYAAFDRVMREHAVERLCLEKELRWAVDSQAFELLYQPIVELATGRVSGFETLLRWRHPQRGTISPQQFISIAEETGLIIPIGRWVLRHACLQMQAWHRRLPAGIKPPVLSVNLSSKELMQQDLLEHIDSILVETGFRPGWLDLEITESAIIENDVVAASMFRELRSRGIRLSIDDFGMGYSSLSYLHRFAFNTLKIDRSFVGRLGDGTESSDAFVRMIVSLAKTLGMELVAEGVETKQQLEKLRSLGCNFCQGYLFSRPVSSAAAEHMVATQSVGDAAGTTDCSPGDPGVLGDSPPGPTDRAVIATETPNSQSTIAN